MHGGYGVKIKFKCSLKKADLVRVYKTCTKPTCKSLLFKKKLNVLNISLVLKISFVNNVIHVCGVSVDVIDLFKNC